MDLVFDAGGTNLRLGVSKNTKQILRQEKVVEPKRYRDFLKAFEVAAKHIQGGQRIRRAAGGVPGTLNTEKSGLLLCTQLPDWVKKPIKRDLEHIVQAPVRLENDSALVGLGEVAGGSAGKARIIAYIGLGTGIGGCRYVHGRIDARSVGFEPGRHYLFLGPQTRGHPSPHRGDWESYISGVAIRLRFGRDAEDIREKKVWSSIAKEVAIGLVNVTMFWSPDVIVVGGSLMKQIPIAAVRSEFVRRCVVFPRRPKIVRARLGDSAGLSGGLALLRPKP